MTKDLIAYFKSESNAEKARAGLQRLRVENLYVDEMPEKDDSDGYVPIITANPETLSGNVNSFEAENYGVVDEEGFFDVNDGRPVSHLIHGKVSEDEYAQALNIIHKAQGFIEKEE